MASDSTSDIADPSPADDHVTDVVTPAMRRRLQQCFAHGSKLAAEETYDCDYANTMFTQCVVNDPGNLVYVEAFLTNLERKFEGNRKAARGKGFGGKGSLKKAIAKQDWSEVLSAGPPLLKDNPWDVTTLRAMAQACQAREYIEIERRYLKMAWDANPKDAAVNQHCAESLARMGLFDDAIACWHRVEEARPNDPQPEKMISDLTIAKTVGHVSRSRETDSSVGKKSSPSAASNQPNSPEDQESSPAPSREIKLTSRQKLERAIEDDPTEIPLYLDLADLLVEEGRFADAESVLSKALSAAGANLQVLTRLEDVQILRAREQLAIAEKRAKVEKTDDAIKLVKSVRGDVNRRELDIYYSRCQREPSDLSMRYELGLRLKKAGNYAEAVKCFRKVQQEPSMQSKAALELGESLQHLKQFKKALECYTQSIEVAPEASIVQKLALFRAGVLATGMRKLDEAQQFLDRLVKIDPNYPDIADRLDKIERKRHKG